ncbi:hypothetical protein MRX96_019272 [Rhipicephalus microplus]
MARGGGRKRKGRKIKPAFAWTNLPGRASANPDEEQAGITLARRGGCRKRRGERTAGPRAAPANACARRCRRPPPATGDQLRAAVDADDDRAAQCTPTARPRL